MLRALAVFATAVHAATTYSGLSSTYGGPDGVDATTGNCAPMMPMASATKYHVAMNDKQYNQGLHCGRCVQIQCKDPRCKSNKIMTAQVTDRCPECDHGDLDMTLPLFTELTGYVTDKYKIEWQFVDCPVSGGVQVCAKEGSSKHWLYVQPMNTVSGVKEMKVNGGSAPPFLPCFFFMTTKLGVDLDQTEVEMTSWAGETIKTKVALTSGACTQISQQFSKGLATDDPVGPGPSPSHSPSNAPPSTATPPTAPPSTSAPVTSTRTPATTTAEPVTTTATPTTATPSPTTETPEPTDSYLEKFNNSSNSTSTPPPSTSAVESSPDANGSAPSDSTQATESPSSGSTNAPGTSTSRAGETSVSVRSNNEASSDGIPLIVIGSCFAFMMAVAAVVFVVKKSRSRYMEEKNSDMVEGQITRFGQSETNRNKDSDVVIL